MNQLAGFNLFCLFIFFRLVCLFNFRTLSSIQVQLEILNVIVHQDPSKHLPVQRQH